MKQNLLKLFQIVLKRLNIMKNWKNYLTKYKLMNDQEHFPHCIFSLFY